MAQQVLECEDRPNNVAKCCQEDKDSEVGHRHRTQSDTPKRTTRAKRLTKPRKELESSPSLKKQTKEEKPQLEVTTDSLTKKRVLWSCMDKSLFFDALLEHGKDFDAIQNFMYQKQKKRGDAEFNLKSKDQIRHFYYRTWHKISPFIKQTTSDETKKQTIELQGVLCYGEIRKKVVAKFDEKLGHKLDELVHKGTTVVKLKGKKLVLRAPSCKAKKVQQQAESTLQAKAPVPEKITVELVPLNNKTWGLVQSLSQNPRVQVIARGSHTVGSIISFLQQKWSQERLEGESKTKLKVHLPPNARASNQSEAQNKCKLKNDALLGSEVVAAAENKFSKRDQTDSSNCDVSSSDRTSFNGLSTPRWSELNDNEEEDDEEIRPEADDDDDREKKSGSSIRGKKVVVSDAPKAEADIAGGKLSTEGLDEASGTFLTVSDLHALLGCPEVVRLEYDWLDSSNRHPVGREGAFVSTRPELSSSLSRLPPHLNPRMRRLLEIACAEYGSMVDQKSKDPKTKEPKCCVVATSSNVGEVFRVPDCIPPRASQASKNAEKRIMDQDLLQQMPIFQKKSDALVSRRSRRKTLQKVAPVIGMQRILAPKVDVAIGCREVQIPGGCSTLMGFSSLNNLISLNAPSLMSSSLHAPVSQVHVPSSSASSCFSPLPPSATKPSLITMEPSELKPSVRRIVPITLNKMIHNNNNNNNNNSRGGGGDASVKMAGATGQSSTISKVITGTDVFLADKIFEDSMSQDVSASHKIVEVPCALAGTGSHVVRSGEGSSVHKQASMDESWLHNEELSLTSFLHDVSSSNPSGGVNLLQHIFASESSRDSSLVPKFDVDLQCLMNESSLDYASRFADIAAQLSTSAASSSSGPYQTPTLIAATIPTSNCQSSFVSSKMIT